MNAGTRLARDGACPRDAEALRQSRARHRKILHWGNGVFPVLRVEMLSFGFALLLQFGEFGDQGTRMRRDAGDAADVVDELHEPVKLVVVVGDDEGRVASI